MEYIYAIILGVVQGVAEFLPVSSSGHLVICGALMKQFSAQTIDADNTTLNVALHFGTLMSIVVVYWSDLWKVIRDRRTIVLIIVATIPVGLVGVFLKDYVDQAMNSPMIAGIALLGTAGLLLAGRHLNRAEGTISEMSLRSTVVIGLLQAVAIIPGISRSGSTIAAGLSQGLRREDAARFSFLIAIPAIGGAAVMQMKDLVTGEAPFNSQSLAPVAFGTVVAFLVGVVCLRWLIRLVVADRLHYFAFYCVVVGSATIVWQFLQ